MRRSRRRSRSRSRSRRRSRRRMRRRYKVSADAKNVNVVTLEIQRVNNTLTQIATRTNLDMRMKKTTEKTRGGWKTKM